MNKLLNILFVIGLLLLMRTEVRTGRSADFELYMQQSLNASAWADSLYNTMSTDERIGQLLMIRAHSNLGTNHENEVRSLIEKYHVGSLCFFQGTPKRQVILTNDYQKRSKIPLMVAMDAEWGLGMRLKESAMSFPHQLALGALESDYLIYQMGKAIGRQLGRIGVHMNFAPVIDVNNNKNNPVINFRSFGETVQSVSNKGSLYMSGMQQAGVLACAKHFPGHGDTDVDSHLDLPVIKHDIERLNNVELAPFRHLISKGVNATMVAHLHVPALDSTAHLPTTLSKRVVSDLLIDKMNFSGLIITDAMEMQGVLKHFASGEAEVMAIEAGNDIICLPSNVSKAVAALKFALENGRISEERLARSVKKILKQKYKLGLHKYKPLQVDNLKEDLFTYEDKGLVRRIQANSLTLVRDQRNFIPIKTIDQNLAMVDIGTKVPSEFQRTVRKYGAYNRFHCESGKASSLIPSTIESAKHVVIAFHGLSNQPSSRYGIDNNDVAWVQALSEKVPVTVIVFGNPYAAQYFDNTQGLVVSFTDDTEVQNLTAQALCGARAFSGRMSVSASERSQAGQGIQSSLLYRVGDALPEEVGVSSMALNAVDTIMEELIKRKGTPGGQLLAIKDGQVFLQRSYGFHTYDKKVPVQDNHVYDLASITKVLATTISLMKLFDEGELSIFRSISEYLPELDTTNKTNISIEDMLIHHARLQPWIPFYRNTLDEKNKPDKQWYSEEKKGPFTIEVAENLYMKEEYVDSIWQQIFDSDLRQRADYRYSDLGLYLADRIVERISGLPIDEYAAKHFYEPLGLQRTMFNPLHRIDKNEIAPTEDDKYFRYQRLQGHVHDMGAAMRGGVSGHAGLFSNAYETGVLMQMLLNGGYYAGKRYLHPVTVSLFTARPEGETRRGLGFDMKQLDYYEPLNMAKEASYKTFGHLGFTGTSVWADPIHNLVFVFLCNRTFPDMERDNILSEDDYRPRLQAAVYRAIKHVGS